MVGACACRLISPRLMGRFANLKVDQGAEISVLSTLTCGGGMETYCIQNLGGC